MTTPHPVPAPTEAIDDQWTLLCNWLRHLPNGSLAPFTFPNDRGFAVERGLGRLPVVAESSSGNNAAVPPVLDPTLEDLGDDVLTTLRARLAANPSDTRVRRWAEGLLAAVELDQRQLKKRSRRDGDTVDQGRRRLIELSFFFIDCFFASGDPRFVNAVLKIVDARWMAVDLPAKPWVPVGSASPLDADDHSWTDAAIVLLHVVLDRAIEAIASPDFGTGANGEWVVGAIDPDLGASAGLGLDLDPDPNFDSGRAGSDDGSDTRRVVLLCTDPGERAAVAIAERLTRQGVHIVGVAVPQLGPTRLVKDLRSGGPRLVREAVTLARRHAPLDRLHPAIAGHLADRLADRAAGLADRLTIGEWASDNGVPIWRCGAVNDDLIVGSLRRTAPDAAVLIGSGQLRPEVATATRLGVVNAHVGLLPRWRGDDIVEWSALEGCRDQLGVTVQLVGHGVDDGLPLMSRAAPVGPGEDLAAVRNRMDALAVSTSVTATVGLLAGRLQPQGGSRTTDGRRYFPMHQRLLAIVEQRRHSPVRPETPPVPGPSRSVIQAV